MDMAVVTTITIIEEVTITEAGGRKHNVTKQYLFLFPIRNYASAACPKSDMQFLLKSQFGLIVKPSSR